jgi:hypothetical protein
MQNLPVYLYNNTLDVLLDLDSATRGVNNVMYQRDLKVQKGLKNQIRIQFKNSDQKKVQISNTETYVFSMFDAINRRLLVEKTLEVLDANTTATRGLALLTLSESDTQDLKVSSYQFAIRRLDEQGSYQPAYSNTYYGVNGTLHILDDVYPVLQPSTTVTTFPKSFNSNSGLYEHKSGNISAHPEYNGNQALHTLAMYMTGYRGTVYIQGTLNNTPGSSGRYVTLATRTYTGFTGIDYVNFTGIFSYIRIMHIPATKPAESDNDNPSYYGSFDKILYRS